MNLIKKRERQEKLKTIKEDYEEAAEYWFDNLTPLSKTLGFIIINRRIPRTLSEA